MGKRLIELEIKKLQIDGQLSIGEVGNVLIRIQDAVYHIGESIVLGKEFRQSGKRNAIIRDRTVLAFKELELGSFDAVIVGEQTQALDGASLVEDSIARFAEISLILDESEGPNAEIRTVLPNPSYRKRILNDFNGFWPGDDNRYNIELKAADLKRRSLSKERKPLIATLAKVDGKSTPQSAFGVIEGGKFIKNKAFDIVGPGGKIKCHYPIDIEERMMKLIKKPVMVRGTAKINENGDIISISEVQDISLMDKLPIKMILAEEGELKLKQEIDIGLSFEDDLWVMQLPDLGIIATGVDYDEAFQSFQEDFFELYMHYSKGDPTKMMTKAKAMRKFLLDNVAQ